LLPDTRDTEVGGKPRRLLILPPQKALGKVVPLVVAVEVVAVVVFLLNLTLGFKKQWVNQVNY
jgi:hypothetical protein